MTRPLTGRRMATIIVSGFAIVLGVNLYAAVQAERSFGGIVVENSYAASQDFNAWLAEAEQERALGWTADPARRADGRVGLVLKGVPGGARIEAVARHPLGRLPDAVLHFDPAGPDGQISREALPAGRWTLRITIREGARFARSESALP